MNSFKGKNIYITGGSSGIGLSAARAFAAEGANVAIFARDMGRLESALSEIQDKAVSSEQRFIPVALDVSDYEEVQRVMAETLDDFGRPHVLINSAGRALPRSFTDISYQQFDETMKINLYGVWNTVSALVNHMDSGDFIVNVSSVAGLIGVFGYTDYCASKFGLIGFSEALRGELKPRGITVSVLCPPDTDTPGLEAENKTKPEETRAISGNVKVKHPDEVTAELLKGMRKGRFLIIPGVDGKFSNLAKRLLPGLVNWIMDREVNKVQQKGTGK